MKNIIIILALLLSSLLSSGQQNPLRATNSLTVLGDTLYLVGVNRTDTVMGYWYLGDWYWKFNNDGDSLLFLNSVGVAVNTNIGGSGATPAGVTGELQYNNQGALGASSKLHWNPSAGILTLADSGGSDNPIFVVDVPGNQLTLGDASATLTINGQTYTFPPSNDAGKFLYNSDGGNLVWQSAVQYFTLASVTAAQDSATNNNFIPGTFYKIPSPGGFTGSFVILQAATDSTLSVSGSGKFINDSMSAEVDATIWYDLTNNVVQRVYASPYPGFPANDVTDYSGYGSIAMFPFDNTNFTGNVLKEVLITTINAGFFISNTLNGASNSIAIDIRNSSSVTSVTMQDGSSLNVGSVSTSGAANVNIGAGAIVVLTDNHGLTNCIIGDGLQLDFTNIAAGYTPSGKYYTAEGSNFVVTSSDNADANPNGSNRLDMADFPWAGIVTIDNATNDLVDFQNYPLDHKITINYTVTGDVTNAGNIRFPTNPSIGGSPLTLGGASSSDYFIIEAAPDDPPNFVRIIQWGIY